MVEEVLVHVPYFVKYGKNISLKTSRNFWDMMQYRKKFMAQERSTIISIRGPETINKLYTY